MKIRRGPVLCDGGDGTHPALLPWAWRGKVLCPNCLLRALSDAIRGNEPIETQRVEVEDRPAKAPKPARRKAEVIPLRSAEDGRQLELFGGRRPMRARKEGGGEN